MFLKIPQKSFVICWPWALLMKSRSHGKGLLIDLGCLDGLEGSWVDRLIYEMFPKPKETRRTCAACLVMPPQQPQAHLQMSLRRRAFAKTNDNKIVKVIASQLLYLELRQAFPSKSTGWDCDPFFIGKTKTELLGQ